MRLTIQQETRDQRLEKRRVHSGLMPNDGRKRYSFQPNVGGET